MKLAAAPRQYLRCPNGPGETKPHTWKCGKRSRNVCAACGMSRAQIYGRIEIKVGDWAEIRRDLLHRGDPRHRGYVDRIRGSTAVVRFSVTIGESAAIWPFPEEHEVPVAILQPAPTPRFKEAK